MQKQLRHTIKKPLIKCNQSRHQNTTKILLNPFDQPLIDIYQIWGGTLIMFEGGNLKAATTFLMGNWKKKLREGLALPTKHKQIIQTSDLLKISSYLYDNWNPDTLRFKIWFLLSMQFVTRGLEFHPQLKTNSFVFTTDENGEEYVPCHTSQNRKTGRVTLTIPIP